MSFLGNNSRPDMKNGGDSGDRGSRGDTRFLGEVPSTLPDAQPSPFATTEPRSSFSTASISSSGSGPTPPDRCTNVIAAGARFKGSLKVEDSVRIDGVFSGEVEAKGTVHVSEGAEVDAKIHAAYVVVAGALRGEIRADEKAELLPQCKFAGEIMTRALGVHEGATVDGSIQMTGDALRTNSRNGKNGASNDAEAPERRGQRAEAANSSN